MLNRNIFIASLYVAQGQSQLNNRAVAGKSGVVSEKVPRLEYIFAELTSVKGILCYDVNNRHVAGIRG
jgi:hypothetical protein